MVECSAKGVGECPHTLIFRKIVMKLELLDEFPGKPGATEESIQKVEATLGWKLPDDYRRFLMYKNGGEGFLGENYLILWSLDELPQFNLEYEVQEYAPGFVFFGSNGGGEGFAFDTRKNPSPVVQVPFIGMSHEDADVISSDVGGFLDKFLN